MTVWYSASSLAVAGRRLRRGRRPTAGAARLRGRCRAGPCSIRPPRPLSRRIAFFRNRKSQRGRPSTSRTRIFSSLTRRNATSVLLGRRCAGSSGKGGTVTVRYFAPGSVALKVSSTFCCSASRSVRSFVSSSFSPSRSSTLTGRASNPSDSTVTETLAVSPTETSARGEHVDDGDVLEPGRRPGRDGEQRRPEPGGDGRRPRPGDRPPVFWPSVNRKRPATGRPAASSSTRPTASPMWVAGPPGSGGSANVGFAGSSPSGAGSRAKRVIADVELLGHRRRERLGVRLRRPTPRAWPGRCRSSALRSPRPPGAGSPGDAFSPQRPGDLRRLVVRLERPGRQLHALRAVEDAGRRPAACRSRSRSSGTARRAP